MPVSDPKLIKVVLLTDDAAASSTSDENEKVDKTQLKNQIKIKKARDKARRAKLQTKTDHVTKTSNKMTSHTAPPRIRGQKELDLQSAVSVLPVPPPAKDFSIHPPLLSLTPGNSAPESTCREIVPFQRVAQDDNNEYEDATRSSDEDDKWKARYRILEEGFERRVVQMQHEHEDEVQHLRQNLILAREAAERAKAGAASAKRNLENLRDIYDAKIDDMSTRQALDLFEVKREAVLSERKAKDHLEQALAKEIATLKHKVTVRGHIEEDLNKTKKLIRDCLVALRSTVSFGGKLSGVTLGNILLKEINAAKSKYVASAMKKVTMKSVAVNTDNAEVNTREAKVGTEDLVSYINMVRSRHPSRLWKVISTPISSWLTPNFCFALEEAIGQEFDQYFMPPIEYQVEQISISEKESNENILKLLNWFQLPRLAICFHPSPEQIPVEQADLEDLDSASDARAFPEIPTNAVSIFELLINKFQLGQNCKAQTNNGPLFVSLGDISDSFKLAKEIEAIVKALYTPRPLAVKWEAPPSAERPGEAVQLLEGVSRALLLQYVAATLTAIAETKP